MVLRRRIADLVLAGGSLLAVAPSDGWRVTSDWSALCCARVAVRPSFQAGNPHGDVDPALGQAAARRGGGGVELGDPVEGEPRGAAEDEQVTGREQHVLVGPTRSRVLPNRNVHESPTDSDTTGASSRSSLSWCMPSRASRS